MRRLLGSVFLSFLVLVVTGCVTRSDRVITIDGDRRVYRLHVPPSYDEAEPVALVLVLHPFGSTGYGMAKMTKFDALADRENFIAVYPDGELRRWRAISNSSEDVEFLLELIEALEADYAIDPSRIYITGASNGAHMTYRMLCDAGSRFAAAATVMGSPTLQCMHDGCPDAPPVPLMMIHGTADRLLPWDGRKRPKRNPLLSMDETLRLWLARNGCSAENSVEKVQDVEVHDGTTTTRTVYQSASRAPVVLYTVENGGHTWPGGDHRYPEFAVGKTARDFNASEVIWEFFAQFTREHP